MGPRDGADGPPLGALSSGMASARPRLAGQPARRDGRRVYTGRGHLWEVASGGSASWSSGPM